MATRTVAVVMILIISSSLSWQQENTAQECRVYQLRGGTPQYETPILPIQNLMTVSFFNTLTGQFPNSTHILLKGSSRNASVYINSHGDVSLRLNEKAQNSTFAFPPASQNHTWVTLAILLQDSNILVYRTDNRESILAGEASLGTNVTARVTTAAESLYVTLNCPAGCLVHDNTSYLLNHQLALGGGSASIYIWHDEGAQDAKIQLGFKDKNGSSKITLEVKTWESSVWNRITIGHNKDKHVRVLANNEEKEVGKSFITEEDLSFSIQSASSVLWSLYCYPDNVTDENEWRIIIPTSEKPTPSPSDDSEGAGIGEVLAWVLAGMALFVVMVMALVLCTRMGPRNDTLDYGASVGVVTSFGRTMMPNDGVREAEEDTEPDSPTLMAPVINHKVPEEVDEDQSNTKML